MRLWQMAFILLLCVPVRGQTTRPVPPAWPDAVGEFALALSGGDPAAILSLLADDVRVRSLDCRATDVLRLLAHCRSAAPVAIRAYAHAPQSLASDIASDVAAAPIADEAKTALVVGEGSYARRANATAANWLETAVGAREGDPVAVVLLWREPKEGEGGGLTFILLRGELSRAGPPRIRAIAFGSPLAPRNQR